MLCGRAVWMGWAAAVALASAGCGSGPTMAEVSGTISFNGTPVEAGAIAFIPVDGKSPTAGGKITNGEYSVRVPIGETKIVINGIKITGKRKVYDTPNSPEMPVGTELLPAKYSDREKTELTLDVAAGKNEKNFALTSK